jgi:SAM-dependent methyltransferase
MLQIGNRMKSVLKISPTDSEFHPCLCGAHDDQVLFLAKDQITWNEGNFQVVSCRSCGLVRTDPRPSTADLGKYYPEAYGPYTPPRRGPLRRFAKRIIPSSEDSTVPPTTRIGKAIELGCSHGSFMDTLRANGWDATGIEYSEDAALIARSRGHQVFVGRVEDIDLPEDSFDLVVAWMVVEHLADPVLALRKAAGWSAEGARLALSVPNINSTSFRMFGKNWFNLQVPTHFYHFDPQTISDLLDRSGWRLDKVSYQVTARTIVESIRLKIWRRPIPRSKQVYWDHCSNFLTILGLPYASYLAKTGKSDRMTVWATRQPKL